MTNPLGTYLLDVVERAGKTGVQAALLAIGSSVITNFNLLSVNWLTVGEFAAGGFVLSVLTSFASGATPPNNGSASLIKGVIAVPKTIDGEEYTTYAGIEYPTDIPNPPPETEGPIVIPSTDINPLATAPNPTPIPPSDVEANADGTVTIGGVIYRPAS